MGELTIEHRNGVHFLTGRIDENAVFDAVLRSVDNPIQVNFLGIEGINSQGLRKLLQFMLACKDRPLEFQACTSELIDFINVVPEFHASNTQMLRIVSFDVPYRCDACEVMQEYTVKAEELKSDGAAIVPPPKTCHRCNGPAVFDSNGEDYFGFLRP